MSDVAVRHARPVDADAIGRVQSQVWRDAYADLLDERILAAFVPEPFTRAWQEALAKPPSSWHRLMVATQGTQVVGFVAFTPAEDDGAAQIVAMGVAPDHRRQGHGSRLLNAAVDTLRVGDFEQLQVWVLESDEYGQGFLAKAGLQRDDAIRDRVVDPGGRTAREVRMVVSIATDEDGTIHGHEHQGFGHEHHH